MSHPHTDTELVSSPDRTLPGQRAGAGGLRSAGLAAGAAYNERGRRPIGWPPEACGTLAGGILVINRPAAGARDSGPRRLGGRRSCPLIGIRREWSPGLSTTRKERRDRHRLGRARGVSEEGKPRQCCALRHDSGNSDCWRVVPPLAAPAPTVLAAALLGDQPVLHNQW